MKKTSFLLILSLMLFLSACTLADKTTQPAARNESVEAEPLAGGDRDEHGCLGSAGYTWCQASNKCLRVFEEFCPDRMADLARAIQDETGVSLASSGPAIFNWVVNYEGEKTADQEIIGLAFTATSAGMDDVEAVENYLEAAAKSDSYNLADGVVGGQMGYTLDYMACIFNFRRPDLMAGEGGSVEASDDNLDLKLECGFFNPNSISDIAVREAVRELFMANTGLEPGRIGIKIELRTEDHARGGATFYDEAGEPASGAYFFAEKKDEAWQLVLHGNGQISCQTLREHDFPREMMEQCIEE